MFENAKGSFITQVDIFSDFLIPPPLMVHFACVVIWTFDKPLPLSSCPHVLWMSPKPKLSRNVKIEIKHFNANLPCQYSEVLLNIYKGTPIKISKKTCDFQFHISMNDITTNSTYFWSAINKQIRSSSFICTLFKSRVSTCFFLEAKRVSITEYAYYRS